MIEIRLHGRGGQGAVTSAELLALAAIKEGKYAQAFPSFGPERRGAPVVAFCRISDEKIKVRSVIYQPDIVLVLDPSILRLVDVANGLKAEGILVTNTRFSPEEIKKELGIQTRLATVDATRIAREELGLPITNTTMLGALLRAAEVADKGSMIEPLQERFGRLAEKNIKALERAYNETKILE
ncbi:MAG: pyruvate ferredoxin oxidoreductase subunit gamma [Deltaproteobacteria bacterium]|nr:pyruvate ferredoxin oxidoreductase subunit gamma [Deltaproteobacteria bacterium]